MSTDASGPAWASGEPQGGGDDGERGKHGARKGGRKEEFEGTRLRRTREVRGHHPLSLASVRAVQPAQAVGPGARDKPLASGLRHLERPDLRQGHPDWPGAQGGQGPGAARIDLDRARQVADLRDPAARVSYGRGGDPGVVRERTTIDSLR